MQTQTQQNPPTPRPAAPTNTAQHRQPIDKKPFIQTNTGLKYFVSGPQSA
jgi:hypothetical protein